MDYEYATYKENHDGGGVTEENSWMYIDPDRAIQSKCLLGFYCPSSTTMYNCPDNSWCSEGSVEPFDCDPLSLCADENGTYQVNFINFMIGIGTTVLLLFVLRQLRKDERSRKINVENEKLKLNEKRNSSKRPISDDVQKERRNQAFIEIVFQNLSFKYPSSTKMILPSVSGTIPPASMTLVLGPSARYFSLL
jgi:hypothetical protein